MKKIITFIIGLTIAFAFNVQADPRLEPGVCHFPYNDINADNETYAYHSCDYALNQRVENGVNIVSGSASYEICYKGDEGTYPYYALAFLKGAGADLDKYPDGNGYDGYKQLNSRCALVTKNFNAGNGTFDYDEYTTDNWNIEISTSQYDNERNCMPWKYEEHCRNATK